MDKVNKKIEDLTANFDDLLYYDKEEYHKELVYDLGHQDGLKEKSIEIAKKLLNKNMPLEEIQDLTNLTKEEIKNLQAE